MDKTELTQIKLYLNEVLDRNTHMEEVQLPNLRIPETLNQNLNKDDWYNVSDLSPLLDALEDKKDIDISIILTLMSDVLSIFSDWHIETLDDYKEKLPDVFNESINEDKSISIYSSSGALITWIENNLNS